MAKFAAKDSNKNITLSPHGSGKVVVGTGATDATVQSDGNHNLVLQTGNSTTGSISITDEADGDIAITPNGTGEVDISKVDIDGGAIDAVTLGTNSAVTEAQIDNININGNAIISSNTDGNIDLTPNGTGEVNISKVDIDSGAIDGVTIGTNSPVTQLKVDNIDIDGNQIASTDGNGNINLSPNGNGSVVINTDLDVDNININGNTISSTDGNGDINLTPNGNGQVVVGTDIKFKSLSTGSPQTNLIELGHSGSGDILKFVNDGSTDALISLTDAGVFTVASGSTCDVSSATFTTSTAQKQAIVDPVSGGLMAVGTVSESSGTPTGDIIQRGTVSGQGEFIRYADGTQICWNTGITSSGSSDVTWTFPVTFASGTLNNIFGIANDADRIPTLSGVSSTIVSNVNFRAWGFNTSNPFRSTTSCMLVAIGRWF